MSLPSTQSFSWIQGSSAAAIVALLALSACGDESGQALDDSTTDAEDGDADGQSDAGTTGADDTTGEPEGVTVVGSCEYVSPFTQGSECREYIGDGWSSGEVTGACEQLGGTAALGEACDQSGMLGRCRIEEGDERIVDIISYGDDPGTCADQQLGCETFGGGSWEPAAACDGDPGGSSGNGVAPATLECRDPLPGEPPGNGPNGQVCTWQSISGCTEEGRNFEDYASCEVILDQGRPYYPYPLAEGWDDPDPRLDDPVYVEELSWVREQLGASACVCCHSETSPLGPSNWYLEQEGNFVAGMFDTGLAMGANWIDSTAFGAYEPEDNNGFERAVHSGFPSTDPTRMRDFFIGELERRGRSEEDFAEEPPFGGPLVDQLEYEPGRCENGEGVRADGTIEWEGGDARYLYVLDVGSANPTVPPNLDLPEGTRWRIDVEYTDSPIASGSVRYGELPDGLMQRVPESGAPEALVPGRDYYLYVTRDVILPITRCVFTY